MSVYSSVRLPLWGDHVGFAKPTFLWLGVIVLLVVSLQLSFALRRQKKLLEILTSRMAEKLASGVSVQRSVIQTLLQGTGLLLFVLALAQPQCAAQAVVTKRKGVDVVVVIDASKSMYAEDVQPSRLSRAKFELTTLLDALKGDRVAIVAFAAEAFTQCPMTSDYAAARMFLRAVNPEDMPQGGSNLGDALLLARQVLDNADKGAKERVVVLLSDGEDLVGDVDEGIAALKEAGVRVLSVGIGGESGEPIPLLNEKGERMGFKKDRQGQIVLTRLHKEILEQIASETDGKFFYQPGGVAMNDVAAVIDGMQKSDFEGRMTFRYSEGFQYFLALGLLLLMAAFGVRLSRPRIS